MLKLLLIWRRGRDSNPRYPCEYAAFRVRCFQPLSHLSAGASRGRKSPNRTARYVAKRAGTDKGETPIICRPGRRWASARRMMQKFPFMTTLREQATSLFLTLGLVAAVTLALYFIIVITGLTHGSAIYLIPVLIAATRWGATAGVFAAVCGVLASAYFFFEPLHSLQIKDPHEVFNLILFIFTAVAVSQLAT